MLHRLELRKEPVSSQVEPVAVELHRLRNPTDRSVRLEYGSRPSTPADDVGGRQPSRSSAQDCRTDRAAGIAQGDVAGFKSLRPQFLDAGLKGLAERFVDGNRNGNPAFAQRPIDRLDRP